MSGAIGRALVAGALALLLAASAATAAVPAGPRLAVIKTKNKWNPARTTLLTVGPDGGAPMRLAGGQPGNGPVDSFLIAPLSWRPDGAEVAYTGITGFFLAGADGSGARQVNAAKAEVPVFAPDGQTIAFMRSGEGGDAIWTIDLVSGEQRQLTPTRRGLRHIPSSFSSDGATLLATRLDRNRSGEAEVVALDLNGGATRLLGRGLEPVYSPDGSKIAFLREVGRPQSGGEEGGSWRTTDLFIRNTAKGSVRRLTRTPHKEELFPSWDPSGKRIAFTRFRGSRYDWANEIVQINADGTCESEILARRKGIVFYGAAWQPGPGREAGPIDC